MKPELWVWILFGTAIGAVVFLSGDGFYRYPCQDPANWDNIECKPPICLRTKNCADDLTGGTSP